MKKKIIVFFTLLMMAVGTTFGQIIILPEDANVHPRAEGGGNINVMVPLQNVNVDQYKSEVLPLGEGWLLLAGMGGAYLLKKRKSRYK